MDRFFIETKLLAEGDAGEISGIAWRFDQPDRMGDRITKGAFASAKTPLPVLLGHDQSDPVGVWTSAVEKADGLHVSGRLLVGEVRRADEVRSLVRSGAIRGLSVGFLTKSAKAAPGGGRIISAVELLEISLVAIPAHPAARVVSAKSAVQAIRLADAINRAALALSIGTAK